MENVRAHLDRKAQALVLVVSDVLCLGLLEKPGPSLPGSQTQVTILHLPVGLLPPVALWLLSAVPMTLFR